MESFKKYFESSLIVPKRGALFRLVFGKQSRNGHFQAFVAGMEFIPDDVPQNLRVYTDFSLEEAVADYTRWVNVHNASIEGWKI